MFAIVRTGGKQYKVAPGDVFEVERLKVETDSKIVLDEVLLVGEDEEWTVGTPTVEGAGVECTVVRAIRGPKIRVFKYKAKKRYRRMQGHRQELTVLRVDDVRIAGSAAAVPIKATTKAAKATTKAAKATTKAAGAKSRTKAVAKSKSKSKSESESSARPKSAARSKASPKSAAKANPVSRRKSK